MQSQDHGHTECGGNQRPWQLAFLSSRKSNLRSWPLSPGCHQSRGWVRSDTLRTLLHHTPNDLPQSGKAHAALQDKNWHFRVRITPSTSKSPTSLFFSILCLSMTKNHASTNHFISVRWDMDSDKMQKQKLEALTSQKGLRRGLPEAPTLQLTYFHTLFFWTSSGGE